MVKDINGIEVERGSVIDLHQTVNGENIFIVLNPITDIVYGCDLARQYEYNKEELFAPDKFTGEVSFEIIGNIYTYITFLDEH